MIPYLKQDEHFRFVNEYIWIIFKKLYGGGPNIVVSDTSVTS
jgi:hypothetical protein